MTTIIATACTATYSKHSRRLSPHSTYSAYLSLLLSASPRTPYSSSPNGDLCCICAYCIMLTSHSWAITVALYPGNAAQLIGAVGLAGAPAARRCCARCWPGGSSGRRSPRAGRCHHLLLGLRLCRARSVLTAVVTLCWLRSDTDELSRSLELVS